MSYRRTLSFFTSSKQRSSPYINHFIQPDTIIPDPTSPQAWNRYSYVGNRPVNANDPSGHQECDYRCQIEYQNADPEYEHYGEGLSCWGPEECYGLKPGSVVSKALHGDPSAIVDAITPTTIGVRVQVEVVPKKSFGLFGLDVPWSISLGAQSVYNRNDHEVSTSIDLTPEIGPAFMPDPLPFGVSATGGPILTWWSSDAQQLTTGQSFVTSGTVAGGDALSAALITPADLQADPIYGLVPQSLYYGQGYGGGYVGGGEGLSITLWETSFNINDLWNLIR